MTLYFKSVYLKTLIKICEGKSLLKGKGNNENPRDVKNL